MVNLEKRPIEDVAPPEARDTNEGEVESSQERESTDDKPLYKSSSSSDGMASKANLSTLTRIIHTALSVDDEFGKERVNTSQPGSSSFTKQAYLKIPILGSSRPGTPEPDHDVEDRRYLGSETEVLGSDQSTHRARARRMEDTSNGRYASTGRNHRTASQLRQGKNGRKTYGTYDRNQPQTEYQGRQHFPNFTSYPGFHPRYHPGNFISPVDVQRSDPPASKRNKSARLRKRRTDNTERLIMRVPLACTYATTHSMFSTSIDPNWPQDIVQDMHRYYRVQKVIGSKRFKKRDGQQAIELSYSNRLTEQALQSEYQMQWLHMKMQDMNLAEFENMALNAPTISSEMKYVILKLFRVIESTFQRTFFDGFQLEPGTVLRCDGDAEDEDYCATFLTFPYLNLEDSEPTRYRSAKSHSAKSMMQILYPHESTSGRDSSPAFCKDLPRLSEMTMYIPQIWAIIISHKFIITCAEADFDSLRASSITLTDKLDTIGVFPSTLNDTEIEDDPGMLPKKGPKNRVPQNDDILKTGASPRENEILATPLKEVNIPLITRSDIPASQQISIAPEDQEYPPSSLEELDHTTVPALNAPLPPHDPNEKDDDVDQEMDAKSNHARISQHPKQIDEDNPPDMAPSLTPELPSALATISDPLVPDHQFEAMVTSMDEIVKNRTEFLSILKSLSKPRIDVEYIVLFITCMRSSFKMCTDLNIFGAQRQSFKEGLHIAHILGGLFVECAKDENFAEFLNDLWKVDPQFGEALETIQFAVQDAIFVFSREIHTPPFLTWALLSSRFETKVAEKRLTAALLTIMEDLNRNMHRYESIQYVTIEEAALNQLEMTVSDSRSYKRGGMKGGQLEHTAIAPRQLEEQLQRVFTSRPSKDPRLTEDIIAITQRDAIFSTIVELLKATKEFVGLYVPLAYDHCVLRKIWGALSTISLSSLAVSENQPRRRPQSWIIHPLTASIMEKHHIDELTPTLQNCSICRDGTMYKSIDAAISHLQRHHFLPPTRSSASAPSRRLYSRWVRDECQLRDDFLNDQRLRLLQCCLNHMKVLHRRTVEIHKGVSQNKQPDVEKYRLPHDLVDCFEATAVFIMQAVRSNTVVQDEVRQWQYVPGVLISNMRSEVIQKALDRLDELGKVAQAAITRAEKALALSDAEGNIVSMGPAGPEILVAIICRNLQHKQLLEGVSMDVTELYQEYTSKLQYQVHRFPRRRLLRDIHALQEELSVVKLVNSWQQKALGNFLEVLDPHSFQRSTGYRKAMFPSEAECLQTSLKSLQSKAAELDALENRALSLREQLKQSVEILEEDHGKAIFVFTMITTIFLPLSFVTSFFGMNTADIRNTDRSQGFFWAIAVPVTACIVLLAVVLAYQGDKLSDTALKSFLRLREVKWARGTAKTSPEATILWSDTNSLRTSTRPSRNFSGFGGKRSIAGSSVL